MSGISFDKLLAVQNKNALSNPSAAKTVSANSQFAALLAESLNEQSSGNTVASSLPSSSTALFSDWIGSALNTVASGQEDSDSTKNMVLMLCFMMCLNSLGEDSGMSTSMLSLLKMLSGSSQTKSTSLLTNSLGFANTGSVLSASAKGSAIVQSALTRLGDPYSKSKRGTGNYVDCSYLAQWAYKQAGIDIPSTSVAQAKYCYDNGYTISKAELQPGDLVFWSKTNCHCGRWNEIHHVGIYAGNNKVVEAKTSAGGVVLDEIWGENSKDWKIVMYARPVNEGVK